MIKFIALIINVTLFTLVPLLITIAYFTLAERKVMAGIQRRKGPDIVGFWGLLQPLADGLKLLIKERIIPGKSNKFLFILSPVLTLSLSFIGWLALPITISSSIIVGAPTLLLILSISSCGIYGILLAGWSSGSKYALIGSLRAVSQMISYELVIGLALIPIIILSNSLDLSTILLVQQDSVSFFFLLSPTAIIFFISILAETNRAPFDLPEAEAELVAGYNVEYASMIFAMFFLGEYSNIILMSSLFVTLFFGGCNLIFFMEFSFAIKVVFINFLFIFVRANLPRFRFDQLMVICWKICLPILLGQLVFLLGLLYNSNCFLYSTLLLY